ncbi:MAG: calcium-binding EGF-like domain-containing protein [Bacteroidetes bacterium]|nr:calcium-binding EGF-like domain-containing protein [Bacteroidota bacterium]
MKWKFILLLIIVSGLIFLTFQNCKDGNNADPCEGVTCLNGGNCVDGFCICPEGYTGTSCELQVTPQEILIKKFEINEYPATNGGNSWDTHDGPDMYIKVMQGTSLIYRFHKTIINAVDGNIYSMIPLPAQKPSLNPDLYYTLELWDDDSEQGTNDQKIQTTIKFKPYESNNHFPDTINVKSYLWDMDISLYLEYVHQ